MSIAGPAGPGNCKIRDVASLTTIAKESTGPVKPRLAGHAYPGWTFFQVLDVADQVSKWLEGVDARKKLVTVDGVGHAGRQVTNTGPANEILGSKACRFSETVRDPQIAQVRPSLPQPVTLRGEQFAQTRLIRSVTCRRHTHSSRVRNLPRGRRRPC